MIISLFSKPERAFGEIFLPLFSLFALFLVSFFCICFRSRSFALSLCLISSVWAFVCFIPTVIFFCFLAYVVFFLLPPIYMKLVRTAFVARIKQFPFVVGTLNSEATFFLSNSLSIRFLFVLLFSHTLYVR